MADHNLPDTFFNNQLYWWNKASLLVIGRWPYQHRKWRVIILCLIMSPIFTGDVGERNYASLRISATSKQNLLETRLFFSNQQYITIENSGILYEAQFLWEQEDIFIIYLVEVFGDIDAMLKCILGLTVSYNAFVLVINSSVNFDMMKVILENMMNNWMHLRNKHEMAIFSRFAMEGKFSILLYLVSVIGGIGSYILQPFIPQLYHVLKPTNESHPLKPILDVQFYIDPHRYYVPIYINSALGTVFAITIIFACDAYFIMIIHHACGMYGVLGYRIGMIDQENIKNYQSSSNIDREKLIFGKIVECIKYHRDCIRFSGSIEQLSNFSWLMLITSIVFTLSITSVQSIIKVHELEEVLSFGLCAVCTAVRLFYISLAGQKIIDHSLQIHHSVYNISWYALSPKAAKLLIPMLLRASRPSDVTAGKLMPLNLHTFCSLIKVSTTYLTFILSTL